MEGHHLLRAPRQGGRVIVQVPHLQFCQRDEPIQVGVDTGHQVYQARGVVDTCVPALVALPVLAWCDSAGELVYHFDPAMDEHLSVIRVYRYVSTHV